jgi:CDP-glucose 4,6-dehydratase
MGTVNVLDIAFKKDFVEAVVIVTTDKVYRNDNSGKVFVETDPLEGKDPYSASKVGTESVVAAWQQITKVSGGPKVISVRAGNVIGGGDFAENRIIPDLVRGVISGNTVEIRNPESTRPWQHVLDPLYGYLILAAKLYKDPKKYSGPWNFGTEKNTVTSVIKIVKLAIKSWGHGELMINKEKKLYEQTNLQLNIDKSKKILKWKPKYKIRDSIKLTIEWYKKVLNKEVTAEEITKKQINLNRTYQYQPSTILNFENFINFYRKFQALFNHVIFVITKFIIQTHIFV